MPRDCTDPNAHAMYSPDGFCIPYNPVSLWPTPNTEMSIHVKSESKVMKMVQNHTLTNEGKDFLVLALDPFHDLDHPVAGYPDSDCSSTVVKCFQYAVDISKPAAVTTSNWDAHVFSLPFCAAGGVSTTYDGTFVGSTFEWDAAAVSANRSFLNWELVNSGQSMYPRSHAEAASATRTKGCITLPNTLFSGTCARVIGMGFEIVDTTADLYRQGALTCYRMQQPQSEHAFLVSDIGGAYTSTLSNTRVVRKPPSLVDEATIIPHTRQWPSRDGAYVVCTQSTIANPIANACPRGLLVAEGQLANGDYGEMSSYNHIALVPGETKTVSAYTRAISIPFNTSGVMLTGLNANSTFRIKFKVYVEQAPQYYEADLAVLATPSAPYDPSALEAYSKVLSYMPVAVPAGDNSAGDWFATIAGILSKIALPISAALTPIFPMAPIVGTAVTGISEIVRRSITAGQKKDDALVPRKQSQTNLAKPKYLPNNKNASKKKNPRSSA